MPPPDLSDTTLALLEKLHKVLFGQLIPIFGRQRAGEIIIVSVCRLKPKGIA